MGADIAEDSAILVAIEKPVGPGRAIEPMRSEGGGMHHLADSTLPDKLKCLERGGDFKSLRKIHRPDASGFPRNARDIIELGQRETAWLVHHDILAVAHCLDGKGRPFGWWRRNEDQLDIW